MFSVVRDSWPIAKALFLSNSRLFIVDHLLLVIAAFGWYIPSFVSYAVVKFLENSEKGENGPISGSERLRFGFQYCLLLASAILAQSLLIGQALAITMLWLRNRIRTQLQMAIFAKALRRKDVGGIEDFKVNDATNGGTEGDKAEEADEEGDDDAGSGSFSKAQVINLVSVDAERVSNVFFLFTFSMAPFEIMIGGFFVVYLLGWAAVIGLATSFACQPLLYFLGKAMAKAEDKHQEVRDRKTSLLNEVIQAVRMIKFNAWESKASARIQNFRDEELQYQRWIYLIETLQSVLMAFSPIAANLVAFGWYTLVQKNPLTPSVGFTSLQILDELRFSLTYIPEAFSQLIQSLVSLRRIQRYLDSEEVDIPQRSKIAPFSNEDVILSNASIGWPKILQVSPEEEQDNKPAFTLENVSVRFTPNALNLVVGRLGSGKTLLLKGLLGEADLLTGQIKCPRSLPNSIDKSLKLSADTWMRADQVAYLPQSSFLVNATLRENILFGLPLLEPRYQATLDACGLGPDLKLLNDADETEIGENGIGLSGGQASRVMLARAVYGRACTLILDDPLSAVDAHTAAHIHTNLLRGALCQNRTVILVTHQVQLIAQSAAKIVMLNEGKVQFDGDSTTFMNSDLYNGLIEEEEQEQHKENGKDGIEQDSAPGSSAETSLNTTPATTAPPSPQLKPDDLPKKPKKLVEEEKRAKGAVLRSIYARYIKSCGGLPVVVIVSLTLIAFNLMVIVITKWLQYWTEDVERGLKDEHARHHSDVWWLTWLSMIWLFEIALEAAKMLTLVFASLQASKVLFKEMLRAVLKAPLRFHDTVSRGRLLNRFSYDFKEMDSEVVDTFDRTADQGISIVITMTAIATGGGLPFIGFFILMVPLYVYVGQLYLLAVRDLKRLASTSRSPILNTIGDVIRGTVVIRAFGAVDYFYATLVERMNAQTTYNFFICEVRFWYEEMFNTFSFFVLLVAIVFILLNTAIKAAHAGFIFTFLINAHVHILFFLRAITEMEQKLVSVERIVEYSKLEGERETEVDGSQIQSTSLSPQWPEQGEIEVDNLHVRYASDLPEVLHGVTFKVAPHSKVGVVGPTGCGKSTLASAFFRFVEKTQGCIKIDGVDIGHINLEELRSRLQIVPQDPIIFSGPLRASLDVFDEYTDDEVIAALKKVRLVKADDSQAPLVDVEPNSEQVATTQKRDFSDLNFMVAEGGSNLSNGEKQLLCLARAILRNCKLIIFDEATSSVDFDTDAIISQTIPQAFERSTIITIAHRLRTIIDYDFVAVMEKGNVVEFEKPSTLLRDSTSRFYKLCRASGKRELVHLKQSAGIE
ncbi:P-loop containing nucleoside triphosphate hydrolase protein [Meira miltonrushii]|uniref:P-loop containing nucleoside triphosphate hydrolase protein n=1 Tax=Meira miltonrushii TaxID=1280837 RepID=A0A316V295_9BASI|nr:P-loop containing nucleoside triphosphate hydrolase protein [Meira miltonrushii]PWN31582.1 P-loop containing nucleoside triphosphate hydrolase protein [Meira miltonrushii]